MSSGTDFAGYYYYKPSKLFLSMIGLWPDRATRFGLAHFCCCVLLVSVMIPQLSPLVRGSMSSMEVLLKNLPSLTVCGMSLLKYSAFVINKNVLQVVLEDIRCDWRAVESSEELRIYKKYAGTGRLQTIVYATFSYACVFSVTIFVMMSRFVLNLPQSETGIAQMPIVIDYPLEGEEYYLLIQLHFAVAMFISITIMFSTETMFFMYVRHACGLFQVARHQIIQAYSSSFMRPLLPARTSDIHGAILKAIREHEKAQKLMVFVQDHFAFPYFVQLILGVLLLTGNMYRLAQVFLLDTLDASEALAIISLTIGQLGVMFYINYEMQNLAEACQNFHIDPYQTEWYEAPLYIQKLLLIILAFSGKVNGIDLYGLYSPSVEGFASHFRLSWSYFMMLHSVQQM